jgi:hypothetical protein
VENRECRLIFLLKRPAKQKARKLRKKAGPIPEMGNTNSPVIPSGLPSSVFWMTERRRGTLRFS